MHGKEKTRLVAESLRSSADWIERVVNEVRLVFMLVLHSACGAVLAKRSWLRVFDDGRLLSRVFITTKDRERARPPD